jgi:hypothetical protein
MKTSVTPVRKAVKKRVALDFPFPLIRKKIMKTKRIEAFSTLMVNGEIKNHFILNAIFDILLNSYQHAKIYYQIGPKLKRKN